MKKLIKYISDIGSYFLMLGKVFKSHTKSSVMKELIMKEIDDLIINEFKQVMDIGEMDITQHWLGVYPSADDVVFKASPEKGVVVGAVTSGTGASTGFAFGEELIELVLESK